MELRVFRVEEGRTTRVVVDVPDSDLHDLRLDTIDLAMLREPPQNAADVLLDLELIARRIGEQATSKPVPSSP